VVADELETTHPTRPYAQGLHTPATRAYLSLDLNKDPAKIVSMDTLSAIAEPNRRKIIQLLAQRGNLTASEIARHFQSSAPAISQHLRVLIETKAVFVTRQAQKRIYSLNPEPLQELSGWLFDLTNQWDQRLNKIDALLGNEQKDSNSYKSPSRRGRKNG